MYYTKKLLGYFLANAVVFYLAQMLVGDMLIFGRAEISPMQALITTSFGIALVTLLVDLLLKDFNIKIQPDKYLTLELLVNIAAIYLLARTPLQNSVGIGITAFWVAIIIGFGLSIAQYVAKNITDKFAA
ncbi:hypothetical protein KBC70_03775 [Candidatus Woesebacteria bacterium]|nr:hypothetical protein [Candidatus Woesebacteria bacterium]